MSKYFIATLGCRANQADSDLIAAFFEAKGHVLAADGEPADVCVVNTCTVTAKADRECRNLIRRVRREHPWAKMVVTGCLASVAAGELKKMPEVDEVGLDIGAPFTVTPPVLYARAVRHGERARPQLKIQDGCDRSCAYCIVPFARGKNRSMPESDVIGHVSMLKAGGAKEAVLTGIRLGGYGKEMSPPSDLAGLLGKITPYADEDFRIRLSSIEPDEWDDGLVKIVSKEPWICPHFHIPLQSGDDEILGLMGRSYTTAGYRDLLARLKAGRPDAAIGADVIVGFPGETEEHFRRTFDFIKGADIDYLHVFPYSRRSGTAAAKMKGHVQEKEKQRRAAALRTLSEEKKLSFHRANIGRKLRVVIEVKRDRKTGGLKGVSENYIQVLFNGGDGIMGTAANVLVTGLNDGSVDGKLLNI